MELQFSMTILLRFFTAGAAVTKGNSFSAVFCFLLFLGQHVNMKKGKTYREIKCYSPNQTLYFCKELKN